MARTRNRYTQHRGIYLVTTLLLMLFVVMLGGAVVVSFSQGLTSSRNVNNRQVALDAALSGLHYVQARMESNALAYSPADASTDVVNTSSGNFQVQEQSFTSVGSLNSFNVCGYMTNANVIGTGEQQVSAAFRICFNGNWSTMSAQPSKWSWVNFGTPWNLPAMSYISCNNLLQNPGNTSYSYYATGATLNSVPGLCADVIVEGLAITPDGSILARRNVEYVLAVNSVNTPPTVASSAGNMDLQATQTSGAVSVTSSISGQYGLSSLSNINIYGADAPSGSPTDYNSTSTANLVSTTADSFNYIYSGTTTNFTSSEAQAQTVNPPAVRQSQLPDLRSGYSTINAGTWVVWNGALYHYDTDYEVTDGSGNVIPLSQQSWAQASATDPPTYNGVSTDTPSGQNTLDTGGNIPFNATNNTVTISNNDASVSPTSNSNNFALVVAPDTYGATGTISSPTTDSGAIGSAQIDMNPTSSATQPPQLRVPGVAAVMGNVIGQGSVVTMGQDTSGSTIPGDVDIVGKSSLDTRSDAGVGIYASGNLNVYQLSEVQAPSSVPGVGTALASAGITPGSGSNSTSGSNTTISVTGGSITINGQSVTSYSGPPPVIQIGSTTNNENVSLSLSITGNLAPNSQILGGNNANMTVSISGNSQNMTVSAGNNANLHLNGSLVVTGTVGNNANISGTASGNIATGSNANITSNFQAVVTANPSPTPQQSVESSPSLDQTFNGLVYAQGNVVIENPSGSVSINGALVAYGGNPNTQSPGAAGTGLVIIEGSSVSLNYNPATLGPYASLLGGQVTLQVTSVTAF